MRFAAFLFLAVICVCGRLAAQVTPAPGTGQSLVLRGVPSGKATTETLQLGLAEAIGRGLKYNLGALASEQASRAAQAEARAEFT